MNKHIFQGVTMSEKVKKILLIAVVGFLALSIVRGMTGRFTHNFIETSETETFIESSRLFGSRREDGFRATKKTHFSIRKERKSDLETR